MTFISLNQMKLPFLCVRKRWVLATSYGSVYILAAQRQNMLTFQSVTASLEMKDTG